MGLQELRDKIKKASKGVHVSIMSESDIAKRDTWLPTPSYDLNRVLCGDFRKGLSTRTWTMIVGPEHSFKSSFMCLTVAAAQKMGYKVVVIDTEGAWDSSFVRRWGLDPENVLFIYTPWVDEIKVALAQILEDEGEKFAIVLDSIGGIDKVKILDDALDGDPKNDQGGLQKELKPLYKLLLNIVKKKNSIAVSAGHFFGKPGQYGGAEDIGGGKAAKLLPDIIVSLKKEKIIKTEEKQKTVTGNKITAITLKNRIYPPFNEAEIQIDFINGINRFAGLPNIAVKAGIIKKGGAGWFTYVDPDGNERKYQGEEKLNVIFEEYEDKIISQLNEWIQKEGFSSVNENLKTAYEQEETLKSEDLEPAEIPETVEEETKRGRKKKD